MEKTNGLKVAAALVDIVQIRRLFGLSCKCHSGDWRICANCNAQFVKAIPSCLYQKGKFVPLLRVPEMMVVDGIDIVLSKVPRGGREEHANR